MAEGFTNLIQSVAGLSLADGTAHRPNPHQTLVGATRALIQTAEATAAHAQGVVPGPSTESTQTRGDQVIAQLSSVRRRANAPADTIAAFADKADRYVVAYITSLASQGTKVHKALSYFDGELRSIAQDVLDSTSDDSSVLREVLERCYSQSLHPSGTLHYDNYFIPLRESRLEWPYDPDFESEEYYDHEERLAVNEGYAEAFRVRCEHKYESESQNERKEGEAWIGFWVRAFSQCPNGPTLFHPAPSRFPQWHFADVPRYLFRAFDQASSGQSDENVVASIESISATPWHSKVDLLSRTKEKATRMLHRHLTKKCLSGGEGDDNLMSWSSSLLFVIQYAIWRCHRRDCGQDEVKICAVDTTKFPRGQFARDMPLLRAYYETSGLDQKMRRFFDFRLETADYDNGEYLSQGKVHHTGRSCVFSLDQLIQAGLHDLYPEFEDSSAMGSWTKRVKDLRLGWSIEHTTTQVDIRRAFEVARACLDPFNASDIALLLLSFKNLKVRTTTTTRTSRSRNVTQQDRENLKDYGPDEVQRYMELAETMMPEDREDCDALSWLLSSVGTQPLAQVFEST
ncbi:uncharacterized protein B0H64DRAFT_102348 [Chaetomium fimeti]|uniref:DUF7587 domain-containing protein n=1 Tax=Chaetomium fimeti TaxID=1854472 RepID=A0AAE0LVZ6_9PEZI|nr:hypothetical protein B0H64DRAFT_102348 [Chaetomium fimeti]